MAHAHVKLPMAPRISYDLPPDRDHVDGLTEQYRPPIRKDKKPPPPKSMVGGEVVDDAGLSGVDFRATAEENERNIETRRRALHGTMFARAEEGGDAALAKLNKRVDDPLADERVVGALGWLIKLETRDPGLRLMSINKTTMTSLAKLYRDMGGPGWKPLAWPSEDPKTGAKTLPGLEVNAIGFVTALRLPENFCSGAIPRDLAAGMPACHELDLHGNKRLGGGVPGTLGNLHVCAKLDLSHCSFEGPLPPQLCLMHSLRTLLLHECEFSGPLPPGLVDLEKLQVLDLSGNRFIGELPRAWGRLKELKVTQTHIGWAVVLHCCCCCCCRCSAVAHNSWLASCASRGLL